MIRKLFNQLLAPRHPWRNVTFSELSEMYLAVFLRSTALCLVGVFVPLFLLKNGYSFTSVLLYFTLIYTFGVCFDFFVARLIARFGPKRIMRISLLLQTVFSIMLPRIHAIPFALPIIACVYSLAAAMYWLPYHINFSKIKDSKHSGKEFGFLQVMERLAAVLGPLIGGLLATYINPNATFYASAIVMFGAVIILMLSPEPIHTHRKIRFKGLNIVKEWRNYAAYTSLAVEGSMGSWLWPTFLAAVVFTSEAYLKIGAVSSISILTAIVVAVPIGRLIDNQKGNLMIRYGTAVNAVIHLMRLGVNNLFGGITIAAVNEPNMLIYRMALLKGFYDAADDHPGGYRITYVASHEATSDLARAIIWGSLTIASLFISSYQVCAIGFIIGAICSMLIRLERYKAIR